MLIRIYFTITLLTAISSFIIGLIVIFRQPKKGLSRIWLLLCFMIGGWNLGYAITMIAGISKNEAIAASRISHACGILIAPLFLTFVLELLGFTKRNKMALYLSYISCGLMACMSLTHYVVSDLIPKMQFSYYPVGKSGYVLYIAFFSIWVIYAHYVMLMAYKNSSVFLKNQIKYFWIGTSLGFFGGVNCFPLVFGFHWVPFASVLVIVYPFTTSYAMLKYRLMEVKIAVTRAGLFLFVYSFALGIPVILGIKTGSWLYSVVLMGIFASLGPYVYSILKDKAENILLAEQKKYHNVLLQASEGMIREHDLGRLLNLILALIQAQVKIKYVSAFTQNNESNTYELKASGNLQTIDLPASISLDKDSLDFINFKKEPFTFEEVPVEARSLLNTDFDYGLIVPLLNQKKISGFLILGKKLNGTLYTQDDIEVFKALSNQLAITIENCEYLEEAKKTQERLFTAEKLASIGGMAEGIAHQIMNRLNQFLLNSQALGVKLDKFRKDDNKEEFVKELTNISNAQLKNVSRTTDMVKGILNYSTIEVDERSFSTFPIEEIINPSLELLKIKHNINEFPLKLEFKSDGKIYGIKAQLMEAFYNILDNAYESTKEKRELLKDQNQVYRPEINLRIKENQVANYISFEIEDNGIGIKEENKGKVFAPFFTTKSSDKSGSGIGCYIVKRIIEENHKGRIWFNSEYLIGSTFFIEIPLDVSKMD
jgi:signal transduction histidine kinase